MEQYLKLPQFFCDGMVLQRNTTINIWGWAKAEHEIHAVFMNKEYISKANAEGRWSFQLDEALAGGPYNMTITSKDAKITLSNILIGDVWVCSGQSNMELPISRIKDFSPEVVHAHNDMIRQFKIEIRNSFHGPMDDYDSGSWISASPESIMDFSATAYFYATSLYEKHQIPIGIINASQGGSPAQSWMSEDSLQEFPHHIETLNLFKNDAYLQKVILDNETNENDWYTRLHHLDVGRADENNLYFAENHKDNDWKTLHIPGYFNMQDIQDFNGVIWLRKEFEVPSSMVGKSAKLWLGTIWDSDEAYINGVQVGVTYYCYPPRKYEVPTSLLHEGMNNITLRVVCNAGEGCFTPEKTYAIFNEEDSISLEGEWKYNITATIEQKPETIWVNWQPTALYNGMLSPIIGYSIKGALWYQGESNTKLPLEYDALLTTMIKCWRDQWGQGDFPFLYVQLPNFMPSLDSPCESEWAELRESQRKVLALANTGMIVSIDLGEWNDLHPLNKMGIGNRLALLAREMVYQEDIHGTCPLFHDAKIDGNKITLTFSHIGSGLEVNNGGDLQHFAVAGPNKQYVWATAKLIDNTVVVWNDSIPNPESIRYAWADNPVVANLYNKEGLPASPFQF